MGIAIDDSEYGLPNPRDLDEDPEADAYQRRLCAGAAEARRHHPLREGQRMWRETHSPPVAAHSPSRPSCDAGFGALRCDPDPDEARDDELQFEPHRHRPLRRPATPSLQRPHARTSSPSTLPRPAPDRPDERVQVFGPDSLSLSTPEDRAAAVASTMTSVDVQVRKLPSCTRARGRARRRRRRRAAQRLQRDSGDGDGAPEPPSRLDLDGVTRSA